jgi:recombination protein U
MGDHEKMSSYGLLLEERIKKTNDVYRWRGMAVINKIPTPVKVFRKNRYGRIIDGVYETKSTVDFEGICHGRSIAFEAKSTNNRTSFPLKNIKDHQMKYLKDHQDQGGISFFLIEFSKTGEIYFCNYDDIRSFWDEAYLADGKKSIPKKWFELNADLVKPSRWVGLDYLKIACPDQFGKTS